MKEKYEERIEELENENEELETEKETAEGRIQALQREQANRPVASSEGSTAGAGDVTIEVTVLVAKEFKITNAFYHFCCSAFI